MRIEKRVPFGFIGDWGKLYKRYTSNEHAGVDGNGDKIEVIPYEGNYYRDIGQDVQFKRTADSASNTEQQVSGLLSSANYTSVKTTDAYFDDDLKEYMCVISPGDLVRVFNKLWIVTSIRTTSIHTPAVHKFFYCDLKGIK